MESFASWLKEKRGIEIPAGIVSAEWFGENDIPMIVSCSCCGMTMAVTSCSVDEEGYTYCTDCSRE